MKKLLLLTFALLILTPCLSKADEGMWLLPFIKDKNIENMKKAGFKLSADDIYSVNQNALKDAIVIFGGGCTGEVVSPSGLLLTNHHCGYGSIQSHSSVENDYLENGFWAASTAEEIATPGLGVVFIRSIADVTADVLKGVTDKMTEEARAKLIAKNSTKLTAAYKNKDNDNISAVIKPMFAGNQYLLFEQERFGDVRLVGAPASSIGKFGGDTDNWMWPRHTGDFSIFRIYAKDGKTSTADYDPANKPYAAPKHLAVSTKGITEGDYTMILGFPGRTNRYMTARGIDYLLQQELPVRVKVRGEKQKLMWEDMIASDEVRIKYADKYAGSSNYWKNSIGMIRGLKRLNVKAKKEAQEASFTAWVNANKGRKAKYGEALALIDNGLDSLMPLQKTIQINGEIFSSVEFIMLANQVCNILNAKDTSDQLAALKELGQEFFKDYNPSTDRKVSKKMLELYASYTPVSEEVDFFKSVRGNIDAWVDQQFVNSIFTDQNLYEKWLANNPTKESLASNEAAIAGVQLEEHINGLVEATDAFAAQNKKGQRLYLAGLLEMGKGENMYPDANFTMRMTYGNVLPYKPADAVSYHYATTLSGIMEKENPENPDFVVPARLKELWEAKDFGPYAVNGDIPVAFLSNNDITGGNSGSPVLNDRGELLGLAFDGNWEAMSGDIAFEAALQRTISVDIRYVLFIIDKFAGAKHLIDEMTLKN